MSIIRQAVKNAVKVRVITDLRLHSCYVLLNNSL